MTQATYEDANLILKLYDLRREEKLRKARDWILREFSAQTLKEFTEKCPQGSEENAYFRMVISYWEMAASFWVQGIVHEQLFFESCGELVAVWEKIRPLVDEFRGTLKNPLFSRNIEKAATKYISSLNQNAPGAYEEIQSFLRK